MIFGGYFLMQILLRFFCVVAAMTMCVGCSGHSRDQRPEVYRGGQYYGDALHAKDLKKQ